MFRHGLNKHIRRMGLSSARSLLGGGVGRVRHVVTGREDGVKCPQPHPKRRYLIVEWPPWGKCVQYKRRSHSRKHGRLAATPTQHTHGFTVFIQYTRNTCKVTQKEKRAFCLIALTNVFYKGPVYEFRKRCSVLQSSEGTQLREL